MPEHNDLNPGVAELEIGIRSLRKIRIYPMSVGNQLELDDVLKKASQKFFSLDTSNQQESLAIFVASILDLIKTNIPRILGYILEDNENPEDMIKRELTNDQMIALGQIIFEQNYQGLLKKVKSLFPKVEEALQSPTRTPLQRAVRSMDTD